MSQIVVAALSLIAALAPFVALSKPRRLLSHIRDESRTHDALPAGHKSRDVLSDALERSVNEYEEYVGNGYARGVRRLVGICYFLLITCIAAIAAVNRYGLGNGDGPFLGRSFYVATICVLVVVGFGSGFLALVGAGTLFDEMISDLSPENQKRAKAVLPDPIWNIFLPWTAIATLWRMVRRRDRPAQSRPSDA